MSDKPSDISPREIIGQAIGEASMCWSETPKGVFDSTRASKIVDDLLDAFHLRASMNITRWVDLKKENTQLQQKLEVAKKALIKARSTFDAIYSWQADQLLRPSAHGAMVELDQALAKLSEGD